jgi:hypothetical protein
VTETAGSVSGSVAKDRRRGMLGDGSSVQGYAEPGAQKRKTRER